MPITSLCEVTNGYNHDDKNDKGSYTKVCLASAKVLKVTSTGAQPPTWEPFSILDTCTVHTGE